MRMEAVDPRTADYFWEEAMIYSLIVSGELQGNQLLGRVVERLGYLVMADRFPKPSYTLISPGHLGMLTRIIKRNEKEC